MVISPKHTAGTEPGNIPGPGNWELLSVPTVAFPSQSHLRTAMDIGSIAMQYV